MNYGISGSSFIRVYKMDNNVTLAAGKRVCKRYPGHNKRRTGEREGGSDEAVVGTLHTIVARWGANNCPYPSLNSVYINTNIYKYMRSLMQ